MNLYVFMGTNLPEIAQCFGHLAKFEPGEYGTRFFIPAGLAGLFEDNGTVQITGYDPDNPDLTWIEDQPDRTFLLIDPRKSPVPQLEALADRLKDLGCEPDKITTVVDCQAAEESPQLRTYLDACIYYSDIALLGNRTGASKSFLRNFKKDYERNCYPCLFLFLKGKGLPEDPLELLTPGIRRISQLFDLPEDEPVTFIDPLIESSCDLDLEEFEADPFRASGESAAPSASIPDISRWIVTNPG